MKVLAFVLNSTGLTDIYDILGMKYGNPQFTTHTFVMVEDNHPEIGKKLFVQEVFQQEDIVAAINGKPTTPPVPNDTTFVSANATTAHAQDDIEITLSDTGMYAMIHTEWAIKVNGGNALVAEGASGHNQVHGYLKFPKGTYNAGDVITLSHLVAGSGVVKFLDKPVTNSLQAAPPPPVNDEPEQSDEPTQPDDPKKKKKKKRSKLKYNTKDTAAKE